MSSVKFPEAQVKVMAAFFIEPDTGFLNKLPEPFVVHDIGNMGSSVNCILGPFTRPALLESEVEISKLQTPTSDAWYGKIEPYWEKIVNDAIRSGKELMPHLPQGWKIIAISLQTTDHVGVRGLNCHRIERDKLEKAGIC